MALTVLIPVKILEQLEGLYHNRAIAITDADGEETKAGPLPVELDEAGNPKTTAEWERGGYITINKRGHAVQVFDLGFDSTKKYIFEKFHSCTWHTHPLQPKCDCDPPSPEDLMESVKWGGLDSQYDYQSAFDLVIDRTGFWIYGATPGLRALFRETKDSGNPQKPSKEREAFWCILEFYTWATTLLFLSKRFDEAKYLSMLGPDIDIAAFIERVKDNEALIKYLERQHDNQPQCHWSPGFAIKAFETFGALFIGCNGWVIRHVTFKQLDEAVAREAETGQPQCFIMSVANHDVLKRLEEAAAAFEASTVEEVEEEVAESESTA